MGFDEPDQRNQAEAKTSQNQRKWIKNKLVSKQTAQQAAQLAGGGG